MKGFSTIKLSFITGMLLLSNQVSYAENKKTDNPATASTSNISKEDRALLDTIKNAIKSSKLMSGLHVDITTQNGDVMLKGQVDSDTEADAMVSLVESIRGVNFVNTTELTVKGSSQPLTDTLTTAKIKGLFIREELFGEKDLATMTTSVETKDGVVYLSGDTDNKKQIDNAIEIIKKSIPEVKNIVYRIEVAPEAVNTKENKTEE